MSTVKIGAASEHIFIAKCLIKGLNCYIPIDSDNKIDLIVNNKRCQIKTLGKSGSVCFGLSLRKIKCNAKTNVKIYNYTDKDIDFMIGVNINTFTVYVIPIERIMKNKAFISESILIQEGFKDRFDFFEK